jgi:hypothetical protein
MFPMWFCSMSEREACFQSGTQVGVETGRQQMEDRAEEFLHRLPLIAESEERVQRLPGIGKGDSPQFAARPESIPRCVRPEEIVEIAKTIEM